MLLTDRKCNIRSMLANRLFAKYFLNQIFSEHKNKFLFYFLESTFNFVRVHVGQFCISPKFAGLGVMC